MIAGRRTFLQCLTTAAVAVTPVLTGPPGEHLMYGLIAKFTAVSGKRDESIKVLKEGTRNMPGCRSYRRGLRKSSGCQSCWWRGIPIL